MSVMSASGLDDGDVSPGASRWSAPTAGPTLPAIVSAIAGMSAAVAAAIALRVIAALPPPRRRRGCWPRHPRLAERSRGVRRYVRDRIGKAPKMARPGPHNHDINAPRE